jgi:hypothetical protein
MYTAFRLKPIYSIRFNKPDATLHARLLQLAKHEGISPEQVMKRWVIERLSAPAERAESGRPPEPRATAVADESLRDLHEELVGLRRDLRRALTAAFSRGLSPENKEQVAELIDQLFQSPDKDLPEG